MPVTHSRRLRVAIWTAFAALLIPVGLTLADLPTGGARVWLRLGAWAVVSSALVLIVRRQREFDARVRDQQQTEARLRASEAKFSGILSIAADAIISVDESHRIVHFNHGAEEIFGYTAAEAMGQHLNLLLPPRARGVHEQHMSRFAHSQEPARRMGERREIFGLRKNGREFPAEASISRLSTPEGTLFTVVLRDVTDRKQAEADERFLSESGAELPRSLDYDAALRAVADLPVPRLADACLVDVVTGAERYGRRASTRQRADLSAALERLEAMPLTPDSPSPIIDVIRRGRHELITDVDDAWLEANEETAAAAAWRALGAKWLLIVPLTVGAETRGALTLVGVDDDRVPDDDRIALARKFAATAAVALDNARLYGVAQRATRARDDVLGVVSHDLRNPLSAIAMCGRVLAETEPDEATRRNLLSTIRESADWMNRLIQDLLDVANIERGTLSLELREHEPAQLALQAKHMFDVEAAHHAIALETHVPTNLPLVVADGARVVQVLGNLLRNAIKFTPDSGRIAIGVERRDGNVVFSVTDSGPGISAENAARVFDRFWQSADGARTKGSGLGLSIARGIVKAHGGDIWIASTDGHGSTFSFALPVSGPRSGQTAE